MSKPFAQACEENKAPILAVLAERLQRPGKVLEVGTGTGQHACHFARALPHLTWQTSDLEKMHPGIQLWLAEAGLPNLLPPLVLDLADPGSWPGDPYDAVYAANVAHIISESLNRELLRLAARVLRPGGQFLLYGPFMYSGRHISASNARFDAMLRIQSTTQGVRDFDELHRHAEAVGLLHVETVVMPANNHILVWQRS